MSTRSVNEIVKQFNTTMNSLLRFIEQKTRDEIVAANIDRAKKRLSTLKQTMGDEASIDESSKFFIEYTENILEVDPVRRDNFFLTLDIRAKYISEKGNISHADEFLFSLTDSIREMYKTISQQEKANVYKQVLIMHTCSVEYALSKAKLKMSI